MCPERRNALQPHRRGGDLLWRPQAPHQTLDLRVRLLATPEGVSQMAYILPERLLTLVRPAFDLVLRTILHANPLNIHSPRAPCYMCYMCYILHAKPLNPHSPPAPCYTYYMCYILILYALQNVVYVLHKAYLVHVEMLCV